MDYLAKEEIKRMKAEGVHVDEIAKEFGITRTRVYQIIGPTRMRGFRPFTEDMCIYPHWRNWLNENRVTIREMVDRMGLENCNSNYQQVWGWMYGRCYPTKKNIDRILSVTGLTYEQLFSTEEVA